MMEGEEDLGARAAKAYASAIRVLAGRDHSAFELGEKLRTRGFGDEEIDLTVDRLEADGYLDDAKFAEAVARSNPHLGRSGLARQMQKKGLDEADWRHLVDAIDSEEEFSRALAASRKNVSERDLATKSPEVWKRRLAGYLQRRGYGFDTVAQVFRTLEEEQRERREEAW